LNIHFRRDVECVSEAVEKFRRLFGVRVEPVAVGEFVTIHFYGDICHTCGTYDYFEDFGELLSECIGERWAVESYIQHDDGTYTVTFRPATQVKQTRRHIKIVIYTNGGAGDLS
ncbi:MAG: hypothetical protein ACK4M3_08215, partial [Pyrobaculum sp.]